MHFVGPDLFSVTGPYTLAGLLFLSYIIFFYVLTLFNLCIL